MSVDCAATLQQGETGAKQFVMRLKNGQEHPCDVQLLQGPRGLPGSSRNIRRREFYYI
jgi:hypothetical protein